MGEHHESDKQLVKELITHIDVSIADWYNKKIEGDATIDRVELMLVVNEAVYQYYVANRRT